MKKIIIVILFILSMTSSAFADSLGEVGLMAGPNVSIGALTPDNGFVIEQDFLFNVIKPVELGLEFQESDIFTWNGHQEMLGIFPTIRVNPWTFGSWTPYFEASLGMALNTPTFSNCLTPAGDVWMQPLSFASKFDFGTLYAINTKLDLGVELGVTFNEVSSMLSTTSKSNCCQTELDTPMSFLYMMVGVDFKL